VTGDAAIESLATNTVAVQGVQLQESSLVLTDGGTLPPDFPSFSVVVFQEPSLNAVLQLPAGALLQPGYRLFVINTTLANVWVQVAAGDTLNSQSGLVQIGNALRLNPANVANCTAGFYYVGYNTWWGGNL
jgi:hypothetical protein